MEFWGTKAGIHRETKDSDMMQFGRPGRPRSSATRSTAAGLVGKAFNLSPELIPEPHI